MSREIVSRNIKFRFTCDHEDCKGIGSYMFIHNEIENWTTVEHMARGNGWVRTAENVHWCPNHVKPCPDCKGKTPIHDGGPCGCRGAYHDDPIACELCQDRGWIEYTRRDRIIDRRKSHEGKCWFKEFSKHGDPESWEVRFYGVACSCCKDITTDDIGLGD